MRRSKCVPEAVRSLRVWEDKLPRSGEDAGRRKVRQGVGRNQASQEDPFNLASKAGPFLDAPTCFTAVGVSFHPRSSQNADNQNTSLQSHLARARGPKKGALVGKWPETLHCAMVGLFCSLAPPRISFPSCTTSLILKAEASGQDVARGQKKVHSGSTIQP